MSLIQRHLMLDGGYVRPIRVSTSGGGLTGSPTETFTFASVPTPGNLQIITYGGAQVRGFVSISGGGPAWTLSSGFAGGAGTNHILSRITPAGAPQAYNVTLTSGLSGGGWLCFEYSGIANGAPSAFDYNGISVAATSISTNVFGVPRHSLLLTTIQISSNDITWTPVGTPGFLKTISTNRFQSGEKIFSLATPSQQVTWTSANARTGSASCVAFNAMRK